MLYIESGVVAAPKKIETEIILKDNVSAPMTEYA